jgi:hypothetical protein
MSVTATEELVSAGVTHITRTVMKPSLHESGTLKLSWALQGKWRVVPCGPEGDLGLLACGEKIGFASSVPSLFSVRVTRRSPRSSRVTEPSLFIIHNHSIALPSALYKLTGGGGEARGSSWLRHYATSRKVVWSILDEGIGFFQITYSFQPLWHWGWLSLKQIWVPGIFLGVKGGQRVRLTTLPPLTDCLENVANSTSHKPMGVTPRNLV